MTDQDDNARSTELLARFQRGDARAFGELYAMHHKSLRGLVWMIVKRADESWLDDLTQKVWIAVTETARRPEPVKDFRAWLAGVARNICLKDLRARRRDRGTPSAEERPDEDADHEGRAALVSDVRATVGRLPAEERDILELHGQGLSMAEIGARLRVPLRTVHDRFQRGMNRLRPRLKDWGSRRRKGRDE